MLVPHPSDSYFCRARLPALLLLVGLAATGSPVVAPAQQAAAAEIVGNPPAAGKPLPDLATLVSAAQHRQQNDEAIEKNYVYRSNMVTEIGNKDGHPRKTFTEVSEVSWADGHRVVRVIERDGKPLTEDEQRKESERLQKRMDKRHDHQDDPEIPLSRLLALGTFSTPRRMEIAGRPTIALDFTGNPDAKPQNDNEKIVRDVAGTVWIDEADHTVQHLEGHLLRNFHLGAGLLANVGEGTSFGMTRTRVNDELWMPAAMDVRGHFRVLLLLAADAHIHIDNTGFRKFRATSTVLPGMELVPPAAEDVPKP